MATHFRDQESYVRIVELTPALRRRIEATVDHLLALLDQFEGDDSLDSDVSSEPHLRRAEYGSVGRTSETEEREYEVEL